jgi:hypothetical protein
MLTSPYLIYINKRPLRVAFLVDNKPESMGIIDAILKYNRERWGGRYNLIVLTDGQTLTDAWWAILEAVDPDVVKAFVPLTDDLVGLIERRVSPYLIQQPDRREEEEEHRYVHLLDDGLSLLPTARNVQMASGAISESSLVLFQTNWQKTDPLIKRFTEWNFGGYSPPIHAVSRELEHVRTQLYPVTDAASLVMPLTELSTFRAFTYPIQLCSLPKEALPDVERDRCSETFHVVIGDTPTDVAYFWNHPTTAPQWSRTYLNQVWLPLDVATSAQLTTALSAWLQRAADPNGSHRGSIRFVSLSLSQENLQAIVTPLTGQLRVFRHVDAIQEMRPPKIRQGLTGPPRRGDMDLYRATGTTERLTLQDPDVLQGPYLGEHWMADLYIEFRPERYPTIVGRELWWQLPRLKGLASQMFQRPSRMLRTRYPSVLMTHGEPRFDITLPDDLTVFALLAVLPNLPHYTLDARNEKGPGPSARKPYYAARRSEKGRYLSGLLDLFGGLPQANDTLSTRYWRRMFDRLSGRPAATDAVFLEKVGNTLRKHLRANRAQFYMDDKAMTWLTNYVLKVARSLPASSRDLDFGAFATQAQQEMTDFNARRTSQEPWAYTQADLVDALAGLTARGVLLMGVEARCPSCGYRAWHHIDDAKQTLRCGGCNASFPMPPEPRWHYRLNSLARAAYAEHGLLPVVLVLGQLHMDARSAFLFAPCLDLFETDGRGPLGDLDIAAILDGQFVIGEVKQSRDLFDEATFVKMEGIARRLLPDVLLFASMDREPNVLITKEIERLAAALRPLSIAVRWYRLHEDKFDASPIR